MFLKNFANVPYFPELEWKGHQLNKWSQSDITQVNFLWGQFAALSYIELPPLFIFLQKEEAFCKFAYFKLPIQIWTTVIHHNNIS